jgi:hypothetical protein
MRQLFGFDRISGEALGRVAWDWGLFYDMGVKSAGQKAEGPRG